MTSRNASELEHVWSAWRDATGKKVKDHFKRYVELSNEAAKANKHPDIENYADLWLRPYDMDNFTAEVERLWNETRALYLNLHAYVRHRLAEFYNKDGVEVVKDGSPIPAHLLGTIY
jgi:hypothetical protein